MVAASPNNRAGSEVYSGESGESTALFEVSEHAKVGGVLPIIAGMSALLALAGPWPIGPFAEASLRVHGSGKRASKEVRRRFPLPLLTHLEEAGLGLLEPVNGDAR